MALPSITLKPLTAIAMCLAVVLPLSARKTTQPTAPKNPIGTYDATRDPAKDLQSAIVQAQKTHKRILLEVGGDWCVYCSMMDAAFESHPQLRKLRDTNYISLKVNYSKENPNAEFLSHYPKIADYPHFFVLDSSGVLVHSQPTHPFEHGKTYNTSKIESFLTKWSQPPHRFLNLTS